MADEKISQFATTASLTGLFLGGYQSGVNVRIDAGTYIQTAHDNLTALSTPTAAANKLPYFTGATTAAVTDLTAYARSLLDDASVAEAQATLAVIGTEEIFIPGNGFVARSTAGADSYSVELPTNDIMLQGYAFSGSGSNKEGVQMALALPKQYNNSTFQFQVYWTATSGSAGVSGVVWGCRARATSDGAVIDGAWGAEQNVIDTYTGANFIHASPLSSPVTIGNTQANGSFTFFEITRDAGNASDTLTVDAILVGVKLYITTRAANDA